jgi:hypothetical protein
MVTKSSSIAVIRALSCFIFGTVVLLSQSASAALTLKLNDGFNPVVTVVDGDGDGVVTFVGPLGVWILNVSTALSKPLLGGVSLAETDLNSVNVSSGAGTLIISLSDDNFSLPGSTGFGLLDIGGTTQGTASYASYIDLGNTLFATTTLIGSGSANAGAFSDSLGSGLALTSLFSMTTIVTLTHASELNISSFNANTRVSVPEPATLTFLGGGLLALGFFARNRRKRNSS